MATVPKIRISSDQQLVSCSLKTPLVSLPDTGNPPILNYNLPQSTSFDANGIIPIDISPEFFKEVVGGTTNTFDYQGFFEAYNLYKVTFPDTSTNIFEREDYLTHALYPLAPQWGFPNIQLMSDLDQSETGVLARQFDTIAAGYVNDPNTVPEIYKNLAGEVSIRAIKINFTPNPQLFLIEHYKISSYIGNYGAGKILKTFSLLPGEKTTISIRTFKQREETKTKSENVLDSFSTSSSNELEQILEKENDENISASTSSQQTQQNSKTVDKKLSASLSSTPTGGGASVGGSIGTSSTVSSGSENTVNTARDTNVRVFNSAISKQTSKADAYREIEVNTESSVSTLSEEETTIVREIENINKSRVLNFTFRQLLQEYTTFIYLDRVSVAYTTGQPDYVLIEDIGTCKKLLEEVLEGAIYDENLGASRIFTEVLFKKLLRQYCNVFDYNKDKQQFLEQITEELDDCFSFGESPDTFVYYRKRRKYFEELNLNNLEIGHPLPGIVISREENIFRTDSVIVDALLGHGEALDCFNLELQDATVTKSHLQNLALHLENRKLGEAVEALNNTSDPDLKRKLIKLLFDSCCHNKEDKESQEQ